MQIIQKLLLQKTTAIIALTLITFPITRQTFTPSDKVLSHKRVTDFPGHPNALMFTPPLGLVVRNGDGEGANTKPSTPLLTYSEV